MKKPYLAHFETFRIALNRIPVLYVLLIISLTTPFAVKAQKAAVHSVSAEVKPASAGNKENNVTKAAKEKSSAVNPSNEGKDDHVPHLTEKWTAHPFDHKLFIENKGQFDVDADGRKVLFQAKLGIGFNAYFMPNGIYFKQTRFVRDSTDGDNDGDNGEDEDREAKVDMSKPHANLHIHHDDVDAKHIPIIHTAESIWEGASPQLTIETEGQQSYPTTYGVLKGKEVVNVSASSFKKITYKNIYPGIDISYSYPDGDKTGLKYVIIVHPGADLSQVKLNYTGAQGMSIAANGDLTIQNQIADFIDHAPVSSLLESGQNVNVSYSVKETTESFEVKGGYDKTKTLVIDPWTYTGTFGFASYGEVYDIDYDDYGNVYAEGDWGPYQLVKFNSSGSIVWTHQCFTWDNSNMGYNGQVVYGDFATDKHSSVCYVGEGFNENGADGEKINPSNGNILAKLNGTITFQEIWRMEYNDCSSNIVIGGGGTNSPTSQVAILDTTMSSISPYNPLSAVGINDGGHDVALMAQDPDGSKVYMEVVHSSFDNSYKNYFMSDPVASLGSYNYLKPTGYAFDEVNSVGYVGPGGYNGAATTNAMNGMAASPNALYMYDGGYLSEWNKSTGAQIGGFVTISSGNYEYSQGGLAADGCDNVYVGDHKKVDVYNSSLTFQSSTAVSNDVYCLKLGQNETTLYAGGNGFLEQFTNPISAAVATISSFNNTTCGLPNGSATASLTYCGTPASGVNYYWSPGGQTTQTATGLSSGTYTVTMQIGCGEKFTTTVTIGASTTPSLGLAASPSATICNGATVTLNASGGTGTQYSWSTGANNTTSISVSPTTTTTYTVTDAACPTYSTSITVNVNQPPPAPTLGSNSPICSGATLNLTASAAGATSYSWSGPNSFTSTTQNPSIAAATTAASGTYTCTATSAAGCTSSASTIAVTVNATPATPTVGSNSPICAGATLNLTTSSGGPTYNWTGPNSFTSGSQNPSIAGATTAATGTYSLYVTSAAGCKSATATEAVTVNAVPAAPTAGSNSPICAGQNINLTSSGTGTIYSWTGPNGFTSAAQNPTITAATTAAAGTYSVTYASVAGCPSAAGTVVVTVNALPANPTAGSNSPICAGATLNLTGSAASSYSWTGPNGFTSTVQNPSIVGATTLATGTYTLTVKSAAGCAAALPATVSVTVNSVPPAPTTGSNSPICSGQTLNLTSSAAGATTYSWTGPNSFTSGVQNPSIAGATTAASGNYTVTATAPGGCTSPQSIINITVNPTPAAPTAGSNSPICAGATLNLTATGGSSTYNWSGPNAFTSTTQNPSIAGATAAAAGTYTVTTSSALGCKSANATVTVTINPVPVAPTLGSNSPICSGSNLNLTASSAGATTYSWSGPNSFISGAQNPTITAATTAASGTYTVTATQGSCTSTSANITVVVNPTPTVTIAPVAVTMCPGASANLTASNTAGAGSYTWTPNSAINVTTGANVTVNPTVTTTYTVNETSALGCPAAPATIVVTVANSLTVSVTPAAPKICDGDSVQLSAAGASSFTWKSSTGLSCTACPSPYASPTGTITYTVVGKSGACSDSANVTVTVNPTPTISVAISGIAAAVCPGDSMGMTASGAGAGGGYVWTPSTGLNCSTCASVNAGPAATTTYTVTGTNSFGCSSTATQVITVYPKPVITMTPSSAIICEGDTVSLHASGVTTYSWAPDSELNVQTGPVVIASPTTTVTYTVSGKGVGGCKTKDSATVTVNPKPAVTIVPPNPSVCAGTGVLLTASGANTYAWTPTSGLVPTVGSPITATPTATTTYTVIGTSLFGCKDTVKETVTVNPNPGLTINNPSPSICFGDSANIIVSGAGIGGTYTWTPSTGLNVTTGDSVWAAPSSNATYSVTGTTAAGCISSSTAVVVSVGTLTVTASSAKTTLCSGGSTKINAGGAATYTWAPSSGLSATTGASVTANPTVTTTYTVIGTAGTGCSDSAKLTITVNTTPTVTITPASKLLCFGLPGDTIHATGAGPGGSYAWKPTIGVTNVSGDSTVIVDPSATATYTITGTTAQGCPATATFTMTVDKVTVNASASSSAICTGGSTNINASGASSYVWKPSTGLNTTTGSSVTYNGTSTETVVVVGTDAQGCSDSAKVPVTVNPLPTVKVSAAGNDTVLCNGSSTVLTATGGSTYVWTPAVGLTPASGSTVTASPSGTVVYTVVASSAAGCKDSASISVTINTTPTVSISLSGGNTVCPGQPFTMTANGAGNYLWTPATGLNSTTASTVRDSLPAGPVTYTVVGSNGNCISSSTVTVNVYPPLIVTPVAAVSCSGKPTNVQVNVSGGDPGYTYSWSSGITGTGPGPYSVSPTSSTAYTCTVTDACGTTVSAADSVSVSVAPIAMFTPTPDTIPGGQYVAFVDSSKNATWWWWTFGTGDNSNNQFPVYQYLQSGKYIVTLWVGNSTGCEDSISDTVYVTQGIFVPNVFTPNGDGQNDVFHVTAGSMKTYHIEIFNRWGERLFQADSPETDWDGRSSSGVKQADGDYYYLIKATDYAGKSYNLNGYIQLIRE